MKYTVTAIIMLFISSIASANGVDYLDPKTAYCYSNDSLGKYLHFAQARNFDGLNKLVLDGECNFVPDGDFVHLDKYKDNKIGNMPVVSFELNQKTLWTFKKFVQRTEFN